MGDRKDTVAVDPSIFSRRCCLAHCLFLLIVDMLKSDILNVQIQHILVKVCLLKFGYHDDIILWSKFHPQNSWCWWLFPIQCIYKVDSTSQYIDKWLWNNVELISLYPVGRRSVSQSWLQSWVGSNTGQWAAQHLTLVAGISLYYISYYRPVSQQQWNLGLRMF